MVADAALPVEHRADTVLELDGEGRQQHERQCDDQQHQAGHNVKLRSSSRCNGEHGTPRRR